MLVCMTPCNAKRLRALHSAITHARTRDRERFCMPAPLVRADPVCAVEQQQVAAAAWQPTPLQAWRTVAGPPPSRLRGRRRVRSGGAHSSWCAAVGEQGVPKKTDAASARVHDLLHTSIAQSGAAVVNGTNDEMFSGIAVPPATCVLVCGPSGAGKTAAVASIASALARPVLRATPWELAISAVDADATPAAWLQASARLPAGGIHLIEAAEEMAPSAPTGAAASAPHIAFSARACALLQALQASRRTGRTAAPSPRSTRPAPLVATARSANELHAAVGACFDLVLEIAPSHGVPSAAAAALAAVSPPPSRHNDGTRRPVAIAVAGHREARRRLELIICWPRRHPAAAARLSLANAPSGVLLHGPPGTGKSLMVRVLAHRAELSLVQAKMPALLAPSAGGGASSEAAMAALFRVAVSHAPCLLCLDEITALIGRRGGVTRGHPGRQLLSQLICELDAMRSADGCAPPPSPTPAAAAPLSASRLKPPPFVVVVGLTSLPTSLDPSLLRAGRMEHTLGLSPPSARARRHMLRMQLAHAPALVSLQTLPAAASTSVDGTDTPLTTIDSLAHATAGASGADIASLCQGAILAALQPRMARAGNGPAA